LKFKESISHHASNAVYIGGVALIRGVQAATDPDMMLKASRIELTDNLDGDTSMTISGGGSATYSGKACDYVQMGHLVVFRIAFAVTANGSGSTGITITDLPLPAALGNVAAVGDRGGVGVTRLLWRLTNSGDLLTVGAIHNANGFGLIDGAALVDGANYYCTGAYLAVDAQP
jgi:hypothetical protein